VPGVQFALWAPNARSVERCSVISNNWDAGTIRCNNGWAASGSCFIPGFGGGPGTSYKYEVSSPEKWATGYQKSDPYNGFSMKNTAQKVARWCLQLGAISAGAIRTWVEQRDKP